MTLERILKDVVFVSVENRNNCFWVLFGFAGSLLPLKVGGAQLHVDCG